MRQSTTGFKMFYVEIINRKSYNLNLYNCTAFFTEALTEL